MDTKRNVSFVEISKSAQNPYLNMNPFFLLEFLELVHEDSLGHHSHEVCVGAVNNDADVPKKDRCERMSEES